MTASPESFTDEDLFMLIDNVDQSALDRMEADRIEQIARDKLWDAIEEHAIPITVCRNPEDEEATFDTFVEFILEENLLDEQMFDTSEERREAAVERAEGYWTNEDNILERLVVCIENQLIAQPLDSDIPQVDISLIKRVFMADLIAEGYTTTMYQDLANAALDGNPLDPSDDDYAELCVAAFSRLQNQDKTPRRQLYYELRTVLGIPLDGLLPNAPYSEDEVVCFTELNEAAENLQFVTAIYSGPTDEGARHKDIFEIMTEFGITDPVKRQVIFETTDAYRE